VPGTTLPSSGNLSAAVPIVVGASGSSKSITRSSISGADIRIGDEIRQLELTGKSAKEVIASLDGTAITGVEGSNSLKPIFDEEEIKAGFEVVQALQRETGQFLTNRAKEQQVLEKTLSEALASNSGADSARIETLLDQLEHAQQWGTTGQYGQVMLALGAAASGNVMGASGDFVLAATVNYFQGMGAGVVKQVADQLGQGPDAEAARAALHSIVGCAGAVGQGAACTSGALGAGAGSVLNSLMGSAAGLTPEQVEARRNIVSSLVVGISSTTGMAAATANTAALLETTNNAVVAPLVPMMSAAATAAAGRCATHAGCQRAVTYVADKTMYVAVQMKDGALYVGSAAVAGLAAASDTVGDWVSAFVGEVAGPTLLPGKPGEVIRVEIPGLLPLAEDAPYLNVPGWPGEPVEQIAVPVQENRGPAEGMTTVAPLLEQHGLRLIFVERDDASTGSTMSDILSPNGQPVGYGYPGAGPGIRTVTPEQFGQLQSQLLSGAVPVETPSSYAGTWYGMSDGSVFGIRTSTGSGTTIDVIKSNSPIFPPGFKVHQQ